MLYDILTCVYTSEFKIKRHSNVNSEIITYYIGIIILLSITGKKHVTSHNFIASAIYISAMQWHKIGAVYICDNNINSDIRGQIIFHFVTAFNKKKKTRPDGSVWKPRENIILAPFLPEVSYYLHLHQVRPMRVSTYIFQRSLHI